MPSRKEHCEASIRQFGCTYDHVHKWIDELASCVNEKGVECLDMNHRWQRHNIEGIEEIRKMYGDEAADAAVQHIILDMGEVVSKKEMIRRDGKNKDLIPWKLMFGDKK